MELEEEHAWTGADGESQIAKTTEERALNLFLGNKTNVHGFEFSNVQRDY